MLFIPVILSIGAIYALIPLVVIVALIAGAAGLARGASIFQFFGFDALVGLAGGVGAGGAGKAMGKSMRYQIEKTEQFTDVMKKMHDTRSGKPKGTASRTMVVSRSGITMMATKKETAQMTTAAKAMGVKEFMFNDRMINLDNKKTWTKAEIDALGRKVFGPPTKFGKAVNLATTAISHIPIPGSGIPKAMTQSAYSRSRSFQEAMSRGPQAVSVTSKSPVGGLESKAYRTPSQDVWQTWHEKNKSLKDVINESKAAKEKAKIDKRNEAYLKSRAEADNDYAARLIGNLSPRRTITTTGGSETIGAWGAVGAAGVVLSQLAKMQLHKGPKAETNAERGEFFGAYNTAQKVPGAPFVLKPPVEGGKTWSWGDYAKESLRAMAYSYKAVVDTTAGSIRKSWYEKSSTGVAQKAAQEAREAAEKQAEEERKAAEKAAV